MTDMKKINDQDLKNVTGGEQKEGKRVCLNCGKEISDALAIRYDGCCSEKSRREFWKTSI